MERLTALLMWALLAISGAAAGDDGGWRHLGAPLVINEATPIAAIAADPAAFHDRELRIEGRIASVCTQEGCFIEVVPAEGGDGIVVNFPGLLHTFPTDCAGLEAVVEGRFYQKVFPRARVAHWQHHSFRPGEAVPEYSLALRMDVRGAAIGGVRAAPPAPAAIRPASADLVDLGRSDFETEGLGIGRRRVAPGEVVPRPSTGGNRWLVICLEGRLAVHRADRAEPVELGPSEMSYIPAGVLFEVVNPGDAGAAVSMVYVRKLEEKKEGAHTH
jgi:mannose-6-phosphate isomerase-like protein (cupin superfamily)